jgi:hypothetical protein
MVAAHVGEYSSITVSSSSFGNATPAVPSVLKQTAAESGGSP